MHPTVLSVDRAVVLGGDWCATERWAVEVQRFQETFSSNGVAVGEWVVSPERAECLRAISETSSAVLIADAYARDVRGGPRGMRVMRAVAQHPAHGPTTRRVLVRQQTQSVPDWAERWVDAIVPDDVEDPRAVTTNVLWALLGDRPADAAPTSAADPALTLRTFMGLPVEDWELPAALKVYGRSIGVTVRGGAAGESRAERDLLGRMVAHGLAVDPRDARGRLSQAISLSPYAARGFPSNRIAPEVAYTARRAALQRPPLEALARTSTWLTKDEETLGLTFLRELDAVLRRSGAVSSGEAVDMTLGTAQYTTVRDSLRMDDSDTVYAIWTFVDACESPAAKHLASGGNSSRSVRRRATR